MHVENDGTVHGGSGSGSGSVPKPRSGRYIVTCPACEGVGRVVRDGSQLALGCRLCWEHGVVARIVAAFYLGER
jgi:hypothetical protein